MMLLVWTIIAGIIVSFTIQTPNTIGGGAGVMVAMIVLAVVLNASFQIFMAKRQKRKDEKPNSPNYAPTARSTKATSPLEQRLT